MKKLMQVLPSLLVVVLLLCNSYMKNRDKVVARPEIISLANKDLPEIKALIDGDWELLTIRNEHEYSEYMNTFIKFDDDRYVWTESGKDEPGDLNWRKEDTGEGYKAYLMDVFYETHPTYPLYITGDTLVLQDCTEMDYIYTLVRR